MKNSVRKLLILCLSITCILFAFVSCTSGIEVSSPSSSSNTSISESIVDSSISESESIVDSSDSNPQNPTGDVCLSLTFTFIDINNTIVTL